MVNGNDGFICGRCGWLAIDDECGCTPMPVPSGTGAVRVVGGAAVAWTTAMAAALVILALVSVSAA